MGLAARVEQVDSNARNYFQHFWRLHIFHIVFSNGLEYYPRMTKIRTVTTGTKRTIYALRCPLTNGIRYIGLTRNPKARRTMHRSRKIRPYSLVDKWTADCAAAGRPVKWQTIAVISGEFASVAIAAEEAIIAKLKRSGCDLLNADLDAVRRRKRPPVELDQNIVLCVIESNPPA
jgi:hypothetical protein